MADIDYDRILAECEQRYRKSHKQTALRVAVRICERSPVLEPEWLHAALYRLGRDTVMGVVKSPEGGRPNKLGRDLSYCEEIEDYISMGATPAEARRILKGNLEWQAAESGKRVEITDAALSQIWIRHRKRLGKPMAPRTR